MTRNFWWNIINVLKKLKLNIGVLRILLTTWGRFGFDGGKMGLISGPSKAWTTRKSAMH